MAAGGKNPNGSVIWLTGIPGSGKTTISRSLEKKLLEHDIKVRVLDGDEIRTGLNSDLGFSDEDRMENIRRIGEVAKLFANTSFLVIVAVIAPFKKARDRVRQSLEPGRYIEVFLDCPIEICERRDVKGNYSKARTGELKDFTGISSSYERPPDPEIHLKTGESSIEICVQTIIQYIRNNVNSTAMPEIDGVVGRESLQ